MENTDNEVLEPSDDSASSDSQATRSEGTAPAADAATPPAESGDAAAKTRRKPALQARVLVDVPSHGLLCGQIVQASAKTIKALVEGGQADAHPDAVAYAQSASATVV